MAIELQKMGYYPAGNNTDTKNEVTVTAHTYSDKTGYSNRMDNYYITNDTYHFADTLGNTMDYSISYQLNHKGDFYFVRDLQVNGCKTSNVKDYNRLCGSNSPTKTINTLPLDSQVELYDETKTYLMIGGVLLVLCIPVLFLGAE